MTCWNYSLVDDETGYPNRYNILMTRVTNLLKSPLVVVIVAAGLILAVALAYRFSNQLPLAPTESFTLIDGSQVSLADLRGKPVLVSFWSTTCNTCVAKTPEMNAFYNEMHPLGFEMIAVAMPYDPPTRVVEFAEKLEMPYPVALDHEAKLVRVFGNVQVTPTNILVTADGHIAWRKHGELDTKRLRGTIEHMLKEPGAKS